MSKRKIAYLLSAVGVTSVGAAAFVYGAKNNTVFDVFNNDAPKEPEIAVTRSWPGRISNPEYTKSINVARDFVLRFKDEIGAPGMVIGVSVNGKTVWAEGVGMADVENRVPCHPETVMRIASISKSMTMAVLAKLWEEGKVDLDTPIQKYVPNFPVKKYDGKEVTITTRMLASHLAGIRHYTKKGEEESGPDTRFKEFYLKDRFENVEEALKLFQDDELMSYPGTTYLYSTHGYTLLSAVVEGVEKEPFPNLMKAFFRTLGLKNTYLDENDTIIYHRSRYYARNKRGRLTNVPFADNSYKWAGGGLLSNVGDLLHFCNAMLASYQHKPDIKPGFLRPKTVQVLWTPLSKEGYGLGWHVAPYKDEHHVGAHQHFRVGHSGGAVGASSVIIILPTEEVSEVPSGVAVAIITNLQDVALSKLALEVAQLFLKENVQC